MYVSNKCLYDLVLAAGLSVSLKKLTKHTITIKSNAINETEASHPNPKPKRNRIDEFNTTVR